jgi:membrane-associated PAP2 superfamily phosphatase
LTRRTAFILILAIGVATGLVFGLDPRLDLQISALFYDQALRTWPADQHVLLAYFREFNTVLAAILVIIAVGALVLASIRRRALGFLSQRVAAFLVGVVLLGPGLIANVLLKPHWGRPRPAEVTEFGGPLHFTPWWNPFGECDGNCSFVSGEESLAVWLIAWAIVLPERYRGAALAIALLHCALMGACRIAMGGHFTSDVLFAAVFTGLSIWVTYWVAFRGAATAPGGYRRGTAPTPS